MDEKLKKIIYIVLGAFVILFLFLFIISSCSNKKYSFKDLELQIVKNAKSYYKVHESELPSINTVLTVSLPDLTNKGIIGNINKLVSNDSNCSGYLTIENNNNYYMYSPQITCVNTEETYESKNLANILLENIVTSGNGLYSIGNSYYFRGDNVNNYIMFDGLLWRIVKINDDNSVRLIEAGMREPVVWDDRYNSEMSSTTGINNYIHDNINSRIKDNLEAIYNNTYIKKDILSDDAKGYIKETSLCIGKRSLEETTNDGSIECSQTIDNQYIGLLQLNEYIIASLDNSCINAESTSCSNYNYLADFENSYWTLTGNSENNSQVYKIYNTVTSSLASNSGMARMVINISENTNINGKGTIDEPYVVSGMSNEIRKIG